MSSEIGQFVIGESAIGETPTLNPDDTIISQYANSPTLVQLIENFGAYVNPQANIDAFFDNMWNINTAVGYGLDVWGRILGADRTVRVPTTGSRYLGWAEADGDGLATGWGLAPWYGGVGLTENFTMNDAQFRTVLLAKAAANICDGSTRAMTQILLLLFPGRGRAYVRDNLDMSLTYMFGFTLTPTEIATVVQSGVLPRPTGISTNFAYI
jgi:hypothetical protein